MKIARRSRKARASLVAAVLAAAIVLTGTMAWQNMSQVTRNEFMADKNPGGRIHDDFNGTENKDVYAENFTDLDRGAPVLVRIRLEEYMETGEEAGINRTDDSGHNVSMASRKVKPLVDGADINDTSTWFIHKPGVADPFHDFWDWDQDGSTVYMPTFNKNKDSLSVDVNGTYVGPNKIFDDVDPYKDYEPYTDGQSKTADAYYDADGNDDDEYVEGVSPAPGAGGDKKDDPGVTEPNYAAVNEEHIAQSTLAGLGVITMQEWLDAGKPVCNKWVWDEDGWFYWPEPVMPQTATGLLLDKVTQKTSPTEKCYYAINIVGQFVDTNKNSWGEPNSAAAGDPSNATGFYMDGLTENALALLEQAAEVTVGGDGKWYLPIFGENGDGSRHETNLYREVLNDKGDFSAPICAFEDRTIGNTGDRGDVVYVEAGVSVGSKDYGKYFLPPTATENYYRAPGSDKLLGTADDDRLWLVSGAFPGGTIVDNVADTVTVSAPTGVTEIETGKVEVEVGTSLPAFNVSVTMDDGSPAASQDVTWEVKASDGSALAAGTVISAGGVLTVDENETVRELTVTARCKLDDRVMGTYKVKVYGKPNVKISVVGGGAATVRAGETLRLQAQFCRGDEAVIPQPAAFTWNVTSKARTAIPAGTLKVDADASDASQAVLTVSRDIATNATVTATCAECSNAIPLDITITDPEAVTFSVTETGGKTAAEAGQTLNFKATPSKSGVLADETVTWKAYGADGNEITAGLTLTPNDSDNTVAVKVLDTFVLDANNGTITVKADPDDATIDASVVGEATFTVTPPDGIVITPDPAKVKPGETLQLTAKVMNGSNEYASHQVTWKATDSSGVTISGVSIDTAGNLTVGSSVAVDTEITVTATSTVKTDLSATTTVQVDDGLLKYDGIKYMVLYQDTENNRQLIMAKYLLPGKGFGDYSSSTRWKWTDSYIRDYLNKPADDPSGFLYGKTELQAAMADPTGTTIYTRKMYGSTDTSDDGYDSTTDMVFVLSEADCFGTFNGSEVRAKKDYTVPAKGKLFTDNDERLRATYSDGRKGAWWTRAPWLYDNWCLSVYEGGTPYPEKLSVPYGIRPALWVKINP